MTGTMRRIAQLWRPHRWLGAGLALSMLLQVVFTVVLAYALKVVVDGIVAADVSRSAVPVVVLLAGALLVSAAAAAWGARLAARAAASILADVRSQMFDRLNRLSIGFFNRAKEGDLIAHFSTDIAQLSDGAIKRPLAGLRSAVSLLFYAPFMLALDARLALPAFVATPIAVYAAIRLSPDVDRALDEEKQRIGGVLDTVTEQIRAQRVIRAFGIVGRSRRRFDDVLTRLHESSMRAEFRLGMVGVVSEYSIATVQLVIVAIGAVMAFNGSLEAGTFAAFVALLTEFAWESTVIGRDVLPQIRQAGAGIRRVDLLLNAGPTIDDARGETPALSALPGLRFEGVSFSYRGDGSRQLDDVSLEIPGGSHVAIVGPSGSGKSTLLDLIMRFYDADAGVIAVDGHDLAAMDRDVWRSHCGIVFQDTLLFNAALRENIITGDPTADDAAVSGAVRAAGLADLVGRLDDGLDTVLGADGRHVSGGERQRIGLARALIRQPNLLLLDEVTAALDPAAEQEINTTIERLRGGRTIVAVTHRLQAAAGADLVVVMSNGRVAESGAFDELLDGGGLLADLWQKQEGFSISRDGRSASITPSRLGAVPLFSSLDAHHLAGVARRFSTRFFDADAVVMRQGEPADLFFVIVRGVVAVVAESQDEPERVIAYLEDGDFFGEMALLADTTRNATVRALTPTTTLSLDRHDFVALMAEWPDVAATINATADARAEQNRLV